PPPPPPSARSAAPPAARAARAAAAPRGSAAGSSAGGAGGGAVAGGAAGGSSAGGAGGGAVAGGGAGGSSAGGAGGGAVAGGAAGGSSAGGAAGGAVAGGAAGGSSAGGSTGGSAGGAGGSAGGAGGSAGGAVAGGAAGGAVAGGSAGGSGTCSPACPGGYACSSGACTGGNVNGLVLNVITHQVSGRVLLNGLPPTSTCLSASRATVRFTEATRGYTFDYVIPCPPGGGAMGTPFDFSGTIFPGTYRVTVAGNVSNLPSQSYVVAEAFPVTGDVLNQSLNVLTYQAGGTVLLNGVTPTSTCLSASRATVRFADATRGYTFDYVIPCPSGGGAAGTPFAWSGPIFPGTYRVTVAGNVSNLPSQSYVIAEALPVTGDALNQSLNVLTYQAGGTVLLNGLTPTSTCLSASRATVRFADAARGYTFDYVIPCPSGGGAAGTPFTFSGPIFPGRYLVTVAGNVSTLPTQQYVAVTALVVP
ncbi:MAG: hypothetical protein JNJ54_21400, partial [Myxococcaceae bacterium]|nr:hypothetical protein [Myxococcaceae bacterium]